MLYNWIGCTLEAITNLYFCSIYSSSVYDLKYILIYKIQTKGFVINCVAKVIQLNSLHTWNITKLHFCSIYSNSVYELKYILIYKIQIKGFVINCVAKVVQLNSLHTWNITKLHFCSIYSNSVYELKYILIYKIQKKGLWQIKLCSETYTIEFVAHLKHYKIVFLFYIFKFSIWLEIFFNI
jgi:hypothetical protein